MLDSKELKELKITYNGENVESTKTFVTEYGEIYIGLLTKGSWVNIRSSDFSKITKSEDGFYRNPLQYQTKESTS